MLRYIYSLTKDISVQDACLRFRHRLAHSALLVDINGVETKYNSATYSPEWRYGHINIGGYRNVSVWQYTVFRAQEPKAPVTYCDHALSGVCRPSSVRLSSVRLFTFSTSSPEPLDGFWWNLVWMKYSRTLTSVVVFRPDPSSGGSRAGQK